MCSRYELNSTAREVAARFRLTVPPPLPNRAEVRPTDPALVIGPDGGFLARWGLEVAWGKRPLLTARAATRDAPPSFRRLLRARVLVPATLWWEWRPDAGGGKTKIALRPRAGGLFSFAGLLDGEHFTLVTRAADPGIAAIHDRMPALLAAKDEATWLDPALAFDQAAAALALAEIAIDAAVDRPAQLF